MRRWLWLGLLVFSQGIRAASMPVEEEYASARNRLPTIIESPVRVAVIVPRPYVYTDHPDPNMGYATMMGGPIAGGIAGIVDAQIRKVQAPHLAQLNALVDPGTWAPLISQELAAKLPGTRLGSEVQVDAHSDTDAARSAVSGLETPVLALFVQVRLHPGHTSMEIRAVARMAKGIAALAAPAKDKFDYAQVLTYRVDSGVRGSVGERAAYWSSLPAGRATELIEGGLRALVDMLAYDLGQRPTKGRQPGRQIALGTDYAIVETTLGDHSLLRARSGQLFSVATSSID